MREKTHQGRGESIQALELAFNEYSHAIVDGSVLLPSTNSGLLSLALKTIYVDALRVVKRLISKVATTCLTIPTSGESICSILDFAACVTACQKLLRTALLN